MMIRSRVLCSFLLPLLWQSAFGAGDVVLDASFGTDGLVLPAFPGQPSIDSAGEGRCVAVQEDGKTVVAGQSLAGGTRRIAVLRFLAGGQPDASFANNGVALLDSPNGDDQATAVLLLENGSILVAGRTFSGGYNDMLLLRLNADGTPDTGFGTGGRVQMDFDGGDDSAHALGVDSLGRLVAAGTATQDGTRSAAVLRCLADGSPDPDFGTLGKATFAILGASANEGRDLVIQASGRIVVGGHARFSSNDRFALFAFTAAGTADTGFGTDGSTLTVAGSGASVQSQGQSLIELAGGQLLLAGSGTVNGVPRAALARYSSTGVPDSDFGSGGTVLTSAGSGDTNARCVIQQTDGSLLVAASLAGASLRYAALRYHASGNLDTSFGSSGIALFSFTGYDADCFAVAPTATGFLLAGTLGGESSSNFGLLRGTATGSLDTTFSGDGKLEINLLSNPPFAQARAIRQQADGKVLLAGSVITGNGMDFVVCRFLADGSADPNFGTQGRALIAAGPEDDFVYGMQLQTDGKILIAGTSQQGGFESACLVRLLADGSLDTNFGNDGIFLDQTGGADCGVYALTLQPDGKIVAAGYAYNGAGTRLVCLTWRLTPTGSLDTSFSADGRVPNHVTSTAQDTYATAVIVQPDGKIVTAGPAFTNTGMTQANFGLLRYQSNGSLDTSFGSSGRLSVPLAGQAAQAQALAQQSDGSLLVAGFAEAGGVGGASSFAAARLLPTGALDSSYGSSGWALADFPGYADRVYALLLDAEDRALLAGTTYTTSSRIALLRLSPAGTVDTAFGSDGQAVLASGAGDHLAYGTAYDNAGRLLIAGSAVSGLMAGRVLLPATANNAPVAADDIGAVLPGTVVTLDVLSNDSDADNDDLIITSWTQPAAGGSVALVEGQLQFTAAATFTGASFTYTISDTNGGQDSATVTLTPVRQYADWRIAWFGIDADTPAIAGPEADPDKDGLDNLTEYALGSNPLLATPATGTPGRDDTGRLTLTYQTWAAAEDITVTPMFCSDLLSWSSVDVSLEILDDDGIRRTLRATAPSSLSLQAQFGRLHIAHP